MSVNLEQIDELRKRANVSYEVAKDALEKCNGDMVEALIYLERQNRVKPDRTTSTFFTKVKNLIHKGNNTNILVKKNDKTILSLPVTLVVIITAFAFYVVIFGIVLALFTGHRISIESNECNVDKVNETLSKVSDKVDELKNNIN